MPHSSEHFLIVTGAAGLEVCAGKDTTAQEAMQSGLWVPCDPLPGAITVNIGDALQYWTDGRLKSTFHRVRMPRKDDYQVMHLCFIEWAYPSKTTSRS